MFKLESEISKGKGTTHKRVHDEPKAYFKAH